MRTKQNGLLSPTLSSRGGEGEELAFMGAKRNLVPGSLPQPSPPENRTALLRKFLPLVLRSRREEANTHNPKKDMRP